MDSNKKCQNIKISIEERYNTFKSWPRKFSEHFLMNLAILGQESHNGTNIPSDICQCKCIYCGLISTFTNNIEETSKGCNYITFKGERNEESYFFNKHFSENKNCIQFNIHKKNVRHKFNQIVYSKILINDRTKKDKEEILSIGKEKQQPFICNNIQCKAVSIQIKKEKIFIFCPKCGKTNSDFYKDENIQNSKENENIQNLKENENIQNSKENENIQNSKENENIQKIESMLFLSSNNESVINENFIPFEYFEHKCCDCQIGKINFNNNNNIFYVNLLKGKYTSMIINYLGVMYYNEIGEVSSDELKILEYIIKSSNMNYLEPINDVLEVGMMRVTNQINNYLKKYEDKIINEVEDSINE